MPKKSEVGQSGENAACNYLKKCGYFIVERNFRRPWGELDIIAKNKDGTLVFVEVKAMRVYDNDNDDGNNRNMMISDLKPEDNLTRTKIKKLRRTASLYSGGNQNLIKDKTGWRIDLITVEFTDDLTNLEKDCRIKHYMNI